MLPGVFQEKLFRFEFPERPGSADALSDVVGDTLEHHPVSLPQSWRGLQSRFDGVAVADADLKAFHVMLDEVGFRYWEETDNPAYKLFSWWLILPKKVIFCICFTERKLRTKPILVMKWQV